MNFVPDAFDSYFSACPSPFNVSEHSNRSINNINTNYLNGTTLAGPLGKDTLVKGGLMYTPIKKDNKNILAVFAGLVGAAALIAGGVFLAKIRIPITNPARLLETNLKVH